MLPLFGALAGSALGAAGIGGLSALSLGAIGSGLGSFIESGDLGKGIATGLGSYMTGNLYGNIAGSGPLSKMSLMGIPASTLAQASWIVTGKQT